MSKRDPEQGIADLAEECRWDPLKWVNAAYEWGVGELDGADGPRKWQAETLDIVGQHLRNPDTRHQPLMLATASGHGIGKSTLVAMITQWGLSTCIDTKIVITANTENQLRTKTWPEISTWFRRSINAHWFDITATAAIAKDDKHHLTWRADAIPWSSQNTEAFAGLHNKKKRIILIMDEGSSIDDPVWEVAEGAMTDADTEIIWLVFGNPTRNTGRFRECFGSLKHRWRQRQIDSRTVEGTNLAQFAKWAEDYGEDSDFFRVRVSGKFPRSGNSQFIPSDLVDAAKTRHPEASVYSPLVMAVDVSRMGNDESVIMFRRGRDARSIPWQFIRQVDTMALAARVMRLADQYQPDMILIDGGGVGGGVVDRLRQCKYDVVEVQFAASPTNDVLTSGGRVTYLNLRSQMWDGMRDWLKTGAIPNDKDLCDQLIDIGFDFVTRNGKDALKLESKVDIRHRGGHSPDRADALAMTFAYNVLPSDHSGTLGHKATGGHKAAYNPLSMSRISEELGGGREDSGFHKKNLRFDPYGRP